MRDPVEHQGTSCILANDQTLQPDEMEYFHFCFEFCGIVQHQEIIDILKSDHVLQPNVMVLLNLGSFLDSFRLKDWIL